MSAARQYELVYIVSPVATDQEVADLHTQIETIAGKFAGTLEKTESWGRRKLAYEIGPHREGTYVLETLTDSVVVSASSFGSDRYNATADSSAVTWIVTIASKCDWGM